MFLAPSYGEPRNGFATPVIGRDVLTELLVVLDVSHRWSGETVHVHDEDDGLLAVLRADTTCGYDTASLGWMVRHLTV